MRKGSEIGLRWTAVLHWQRRAGRRFRQLLGGWSGRVGAFVTLFGDKLVKGVD